LKEEELEKLLLKAFEAFVYNPDAERCLLIAETYTKILKTKALPTTKEGLSKLRSFWTVSSSTGFNTRVQ